MTTRTRRRGPVSFETPEHDASIERAEREAVVIWRGAPIPFPALREQIGLTDSRSERDGLFAGYVEALEALNPLYEERADAWRRAAGEAGHEGVLPALAAAGIDAEQLAVELEPFSILSETAYHAAQRRYLALVGIEQGDGTDGDMWHVTEGSTWSHWFDERELHRAVGEAGRPVAAEKTDARGWRRAAALLAGEREGSDSIVAGAVGLLYGSLVGHPDWLGSELGMAAEEVTQFADFAAFVRLEAMRRQLGHLQYELRLWHGVERGIARAYYSGIVGHIIGVEVPEADYLHAIPSPGASATRLREAMLAGMLGERLAHRFGSAWWRDPAVAATVDEVRWSSLDDAVARLGYDALDWSPALRQLRTQLIGEMSGYGGPNITTRAGTRKV